MNRGITSEKVWDYQDHWINQTDRDCANMTQVTLIRILETIGPNLLDRYVQLRREDVAERNGTFPRDTGIRSAQIIGMISRATGFKLGKCYFACKRWDRTREI